MSKITMLYEIQIEKINGFFARMFESINVSSLRILVIIKRSPLTVFQPSAYFDNDVFYKL